MCVCVCVCARLYVCVRGRARACAWQRAPAAGRCLKFSIASRVRIFLLSASLEWLLGVMPVRVWGCVCVWGGGFPAAGGPRPGASGGV